MFDYLYGRNPVLEALRSGRRLRRILVARGGHGAALAELTDAAAQRGVPVISVDRERLDALATHHQGVIAEAAPFAYRQLSELPGLLQAAGPAPIVLALDQLQDPQNFGTLLRTAAAVGVAAVLIPEHRAVGITPAVAKVAAGATEQVAVIRVVNLTRALEELKQVGLWVVGLDAHSGRRYDEADLGGPLALVVGGEGKGLSRLVKEHCDLLVRLPMSAAIDSLNAAVAGSIVLYEAFRRRGFAH